MAFKKGDFITQRGSSGLVAIYEGELLSVKDSKEKYYSLIAYYNPLNYEMVSGEWVRKPILEYTYNNKVCDYGIEVNDLNDWVKCSATEICEFLSLMARNHKLAWNNSIMEFVPGISNDNRTNPYYDRSPYNPPRSSYANPTTARKAYKTITRIVKENFEQKIPIGATNKEKVSFVRAQCDKLKWSFNTYNAYAGFYYPNQMMYANQGGDWDSYYDY